MWWAGAAWVGAEFEVAVVDGYGTEVIPATRFSGRDVCALIDLLHACAGRAGGDLRTVVDSTNGMLDRPLLDAGLPVYRADPPVLHRRPAFGSVPGRVLAGCGVTAAARLTPLTVTGGALTGRSREYLTAIARSTFTKRRLVRTGQLIERGPRTGRAAAVSFDDGPHPEFTPRVLDILKRYGAAATFFCIGLNAAAYPALVARTAAEGHQVANHTWSHPYLPDLTRDELLRQVDATNAALAEAARLTPTLVRPPYGARTPRLLRWLAGHGMTTALWDIDANDWGAPDAASVVEKVKRTVTAGSVVLMHDGGGDRRRTVAALPRILETLLDRGYRLVTIDRLCGRPAC